MREQRIWQWGNLCGFITRYQTGGLQCEIAIFFLFIFCNSHSHSLYICSLQVIFFCLLIIELEYIEDMSACEVVNDCGAVSHR